MKLKTFALPNVGNSGSVLNTSTLSVEFLRRLISYATAHGIVINGYGYRSIADQAAAWLRYKQDPVHNNLTAEAGKSWHGVGCAYDVNRISNDADGTGHYPATMEADYLVAPAQQQLSKWGLCIPMWKGANAHENWHVQPIETLASSGAESQTFLDEDDLLNTESGYRILKEISLPNWGSYPIVYMKGSDVGRFQRAVGLPVDEWFGKDCTAEAIKLQTANNLPADGMVGNGTWAIIKNILTVTTPPIDYKALSEKVTAELTVALLRINTLTADLSLTGVKIAGLTEDLAKNNIALTNANLELAKWKQSDALKGDELADVANAIDVLRSIMDKY